MKKIKGYVQLSGYPQVQNFEVDVPDEATDKEIEEAVQDAIWEEICCGWEVEE